MAAPVLFLTLRILHLCRFQGFGGVESHTRLLLGELAQRGHRNVLAYSGVELRDHGDPGLELHRMDDVGRFGGTPPATVRDLTELARRRRPDLVMIHTTLSRDLLDPLMEMAPSILYAHGYAAVCTGGGRFHPRTGQACELSGTPDARCLVNAYTKGCGPRRPNRLLVLHSIARETNTVARRVNVVVCGSRYVAGLHEASGVPPSRLAVLPYPVRRPRPEDLPDRPGDDILFAGRLVYEKGGEVLLRAFALAGRGRLLVSGSGGEQRRLEALAGALGVAARVDFLGDEPPPRRLYRRARVLVAPSIWPEPYGLVGPEAMAHGVPVLASRIGGIPEWLTDGDGGRLFEPGDVEELAARLAELMDEPAAAAELGARGRQVAADRFGPGLYMDRLQKVMERALAVEPQPEPAA